MKITVFTPTYNRAYIIEKLYNSLKQQSFRDFEWLIIDDGSTDNTEELILKWQKRNYQFPIRYYKQDNGGKCRTINRALDLAKGKLFFTVDSDDYLTDDALEKIVSWENGIEDKDQFCGLAGNLGITEFETPNRKIQGEYFDGTALDRYKSIDGERAMIFYTEVHRRYKYPEFDGEKFMTEAVAWNRMARDGYKIRFFNDIIWIYEYREDGLTRAGNKVFLDNPRGYGLWLREKAKFQHISVCKKIQMYYTFNCDLETRYNSKIIAESIGTKKFVITILGFVHRLVRLFRE